MQYSAMESITAERLRVLAAATDTEITAASAASVLDSHDVIRARKALAWLRKRDYLRATMRRGPSGRWTLYHKITARGRRLLQAAALLSSVN